MGDEVTIGYEVGASNYRLLPLLEEPFTIEYFNTPDLSGEVVARAELPEGEVMWLNEVAPGVQPVGFSARLATQVTPDEDGEHCFSLVSAGVSRLYLDGELLLDNWDAYQPGETYFGAGSQEVTNCLELRAGQTYELVVEYAYTEAGRLGLRAVRVGMVHPLGDDALERAARLAANSDAALLFVGMNGGWDTEGQDRPHMRLAGRQDELIARVAAANPNTVVVLQTGAPVEMPWLEQVPAVLQAWYPGQEAGNAIADVLLGKAEPAGRLPQTFPVRLEDNPAFINYPGENGRVRYGEGIFVGYRYYDEKRIAPLFPFGHGLSYTTFDYDNLHLSSDSLAPGEELTVTVEVTNSGERAGQEVVQLYVRDPVASLARPEKELKGFAKVALQPGESTRVSLPLAMHSLAYYDDARAAWVAEAGTFEVLVGASSQDIRARATFTLREEWVQPVDGR